MINNKPTIHQIAEALKISSATVSRALNNSEARVSIETRQKVKKMADKMGYQPNVVASSLRRGHSNIIGIIVPFIDRVFFSSVIRGVEEEVKKHGFNIIICQSYEKIENEKEDVDTLLSAQVAGILISPSRETWSDVDHLLKVINSGKTLVMFDRTIKTVPASSVTVDDFQGAYDMVTHLINNGCRKIACFYGNPNVSVFNERRRGFKSAMHDNNIDISEDFLVRVPSDIEEGKKAAEKLMSLNESPDAIFSCSDFSALGAMQWLKANNYRIPQDVSIAGFGNDPFTSFITPTMTSIDQKSIAMGRSAAQLFLKEMKSNNQEHRRVLLPAKLILRESTMPSVHEQLAEPLN
ncbi:MAG: LacI family transcriptional regulator [Cyclobacteriaceae bacterium]|jgi:LacI family transcriptional regulator